MAKALDISVIELFSGENVQNNNRNANILRSKCYVCPVCGNGILALGEAVISCCGITLPPLEPEKPDEEHMPTITPVEDEYFVSLPHAMEKDHFITFMAAISDEGMQFVKLYPEGNAQTRFKTSRVKWLYWYCSRHGLFRMHVRSLMK
ncbi:MAG: XRE family transcriptional regulator [Clostridia bacterium]|nr:XRE family transcriptional regulator [Clostridia bacterium]